MPEEMQPKDRLVTMTFTVDELAFIAGAVVAIGDHHDLLGRVHTALIDQGLLERGAAD